MAGKKLSPEKAAAQISNMIAEGSATDAVDAIRQRPELEPGREYFEEDSKPVSRGSGSVLLEFGWK